MLRGALLISVLLVGAACSRDRAADPTIYGNAAQVLKMAPTGPPHPVRQTVYVPVYSGIYSGIDHNTVQLAATLSIRNTDLKHAIAIEAVDYYDSLGKKVRSYVTQRSELGPMATVDFVVQSSDRTGGPGANFLIRWTGEAAVNEPIIEAVMIGQSGNVGISFTSGGRTLK